MIHRVDIYAYHGKRTLRIMYISTAYFEGRLYCMAFFITMVNNHSISQASDHIHFWYSNDNDFSLPFFFSKVILIQYKNIPCLKFP